MPSDARMLIAVRVVVVTTLLLAALIIQYTVAEVLPIDYLYATAAVTYILTLIYIGAGQLFRSRILNLAIQLAGDLLVETMLVYFTGALDSPFSFLYLVSIITASMMLYRRGGLFAASGAVILYGVLGDLIYYNFIPLPQQSWIVPTTWTTSRLYLNIATNFAVSDEDRCLGYAVTPLRTLEGTDSGYTLIFQDLTEMKQMEAELRLKDRMAAVGELSAGIAHEIRNPLAAIAGSVQVLKKSNALSPQEQRLMSIILKESERLNKSVADFLRFVRPQAKRTGEFDIAASLSETLDLLANSQELSPEHQIERQIAPQSYTIVGDGDQIRQVF